MGTAASGNINREEEKNEMSKSSPKRNKSKGSGKSTSTNLTIDSRSSHGTPGGVPKALAMVGYALHKQIGFGGFAKVYIASNSRLPGVQMACKVFELYKLHKVWMEKFLKNEMKIMANLRHRNLVAAYDVFKTRNRAYIFMKYARHGAMSEYIVEHINKAGRVSEKQTRRWFMGLMAGVAYIHANAVVHRDLKLDNFLLDDHLEPLITDFGFAIIAANANTTNSPADIQILCTTCCGTSGYLAPEMRSKGVEYDGKKSDIYSMGVCLYELLHGYRPFEGKYDIRSTELILRQLKSDYKITQSLGISRQCQSLIRALLEPKPAKRPSARAVLEHVWLQSKPAKR